MPLASASSACLCRAAWFGVVLWAATIFWFSAQSGAQIEQINLFDLWDKAAHFIAFAIGGVPLSLALRWTFRWPVWTVIVVAALSLSLYGAADELHQCLTPGRSGADRLDWTADSLGGIAGSIATILIHARTQRSNRPSPARD